MRSLSTSVIVGWLLAAAPVPIPAAAIDSPAVTVRLEEQAACRLLSGGYVLSFALRTSYAPTSGAPAALDLEGQRVVRAAVTFEGAEPVHFAATSGVVVERAGDARGRPTPIGPGRAVEGRATARMALSTDPSDWPGALLPGDYQVRFVVRIPVAGAAGRVEAVEVETPLAIRIADPTTAQECPFDMTPDDFLGAVARTR